MEKFVNAALTAAHKAGELLRANWMQVKRIEVKSDLTDIVTNIDKESEAMITNFLRSTFPDHRIIAEESPAAQGKEPYCWYIDPIDGTTNFAHTHPHFSVSIALAQDTSVIVGVVYDPLRDETFCAQRNKGVTLNGTPIHVSSVPSLDHSLLLTGFPYDRRRRSEFYLHFYRAFMLRAQGVRRSGCASLDLCYVAAGRAESFWEWRLYPWDTAAGALMVEEAGGRMSDFSGGPFDLFGEQTLASNGLVHQEALAVLQEVITATR
jgi:myo-inositol-1(or 4)-monophosphatase